MCEGSNVEDGEALGGDEFVFALPKNDRERTMPLREWAAQTLRTHIARRRPVPHTLPWERLDGKTRTDNADDGSRSHVEHGRVSAEPNSL